MVAVLLIEDNPTNRAAKLNLLKEINPDGVTIGVESADDAVRALRTLPGFELVITDISLPTSADEDASDNRDGISLIRWMARTGYPALRAGYSSIFAEKQISRDDLGLFFDFIGRDVAGRQLNEKLQSWLRMAGGFRQKERAQPHYASQSQQPLPSFSAGVKSLSVVNLNEERNIRELIAEGFSVQLASYANRSDIKPFFVWCKGENESDVFVEVFGQPRLYAEAHDLEAAKQQLLDLMSGFYLDLRGRPVEDLAPDLASLVAFLGGVFGEAVLDGG